MRATKLQGTVGEDGQLQLPRLSLPKGSTVEVIVLERETDEDDLLRASETSLSFWDNDIDDRVWNDA